MVDIGQSLDVGETMKRQKEVEEMVKTKLEGNEPVKKEEEKPKAEEKLESGIPNSRNEVSRKPKEEEKAVKKKVSNSAGKKMAKKSKKKVEDDDFDDDSEESGLGMYLFWAVIIIIALFVAMWAFTDWKLCVQF